MVIKTITVAGKVYPLRIYAKNVEPLQKMLDGKSFENAIIDAHDDPVGNSIPFLWGIMQEKDRAVNKEEAYDLFDALVEEGYNSTTFCKLVMDICESSGFFAPARADSMRATLEKLEELQRKALTKLSEMKPN